MNGETLEEDCIVSDRGGIIENTHRIHAAVVDSTGRLLYSIGNPDRITLLRSAAKPAQALAIVETGALEKFGYNDSDLALICASHNSEDRHLARARGMLEKLQASEDDLRCGGHPSISPEVNRAWVKADLQPTGIHNNCSGKHAGMLAGAEAIGAGVQNYHHLEHPMQQRVKHVVEDLCQANEVISHRDKLG
jgi:L-asparaginase II